MTKSFIKATKIEKYLLSEYSPLNALQERVLAQLAEYASTHTTQLSRAALGYLFDEIEGDKGADVPPARAAAVLGELLSETEKHRGNEREISRAVLVRALRVYKCPKPWC